MGRTQCSKCQCLRPLAVTPLITCIAAILPLFKPSRFLCCLAVSAAASGSLVSISAGESAEGMSPAFMATVFMRDMEDWDRPAGTVRHQRTAEGWNLRRRGMGRAQSVFWDMGSPGPNLLLAQAPFGKGSQHDKLASSYHQLMLIDLENLAHWLQQPLPVKSSAAAPQCATESE